MPEASRPWEYDTNPPWRKPSAPAASVTPSPANGLSFVTRLESDGAKQMCCLCDGIAYLFWNVSSHRRTKLTLNCQAYTCLSCARSFLDRLEGLLSPDTLRELRTLHQSAIASDRPFHGLPQAIR